MINFYVGVLKELIKEGKIRENDPIIEETKERLKDCYCKQVQSQSSSIMGSHIALMIDKIFAENFES